MPARVVAGFTRGIWSLGPLWRPWIGLLLLVNGIVPLVFLQTVEARAVLGAFALAAAIQMVIFRSLGFVRLLGLGHLIPWVPLLVWLAPRSAGAGLDGSFGIWLAAVVAVDGISLLIDAVDVVRYALGERRPTLTLEEMR